ncbi:hypothetical protein AQJ91_23490 [Streptomyces dysideae]|uniref:Uncharacterized protein n=1 Tax=Streptomyces dysideae TaxID=909626 RepID=A0A117RZS3_9ACTN|nr:hypothetical protein AQJ91_23490 [Streptomyces dysideae]
MARLGVASVGVDELMSAGEFRYLLEVLGTMEAAFLVTLTGWPFAFSACRPDGGSVLVEAVAAGNGQKVYQRNVWIPRRSSRLIDTGTSSAVPSA